MLNLTKVICPVEQLRQELAEAKALIEAMKLVVDSAVALSKIKDGTTNYPSYCTSPKYQHLHGICIEMDFYNAVRRYIKTAQGGERG